MTQQLDKLGKPLLRTDSLDIAPQDYKYRVNYGRPFESTHSIRDGSADLEKGMLMTDLLMHMHELTYKAHDIDGSLLHFPYLFSKPEEGTLLRNKQTKEVYTIENVIINPINSRWEGLIRLSADVPPLREASEKLEFIDETKRVRFVHESPEYSGIESQSGTEQIKDSGPMQPTVTWSLMRAEPGTLNRSPFGPSKNYRSIHREHVRSPYDPSKSIQVRGQWIDSLVQFDCWTTDNLSANKLASWFKDFMKLYIPVLKQNGVLDIMWIQQLRDAAVTKWRQDLISRTLQYYFRTEELEAIDRKNIVNIDLNLATKSRLTDLSEGYIAGQKVDNPLSLKYKEYKDLFRDSSGKYLFGNTTINGN